MEQAQQDTTVFETGAKRSNPGRLPRYDLVPMESLRRLALVYTEGFEHYGKDNWRKGIPFSNLLNHAMEHLRRYKDGDHSEDQLAKAAWAFFTMMSLEISMPEMNDLEAEKGDQEQNPVALFIEQVTSMRGSLHLTYNGGHHEDATSRAFHHGMDTVCNVIEAAAQSLLGREKPAEASGE